MICLTTISAPDQRPLRLRCSKGIPSASGNTLPRFDRESRKEIAQHAALQDFFTIRDLLSKIGICFPQVALASLPIRAARKFRRI